MHFSLKKKSNYENDLIKLNNTPFKTSNGLFFGDFRCGVLLFMVILVIYKYKNMYK